MKITSSLFEAFLDCPIKCFLRAQGEKDTGNPYAEWVKERHGTNTAVAVRHLQSSIKPQQCVDGASTEELKRHRTWTFATHVGISTDTVATRLHALQRNPGAFDSPSQQFTLFRFVPGNKITRKDKLLLVFDALAVSTTSGRASLVVKLLHGDTFKTTKVSIFPLMAEVKKLVPAISRIIESPKPPELILNHHCPACEFQNRCKENAVEADELSLLGGMSAKERARFHQKGIFTLTQLSYTFRNRRRQKASKARPLRYSHALRALALRNNQAYVIQELPPFPAGTLVYLDVETIPDREFTYLIGLRVPSAKTSRQYSFWADGESDEKVIWRAFLSLLKSIAQPILLHYGSVDTLAIQRMRSKYGGVPKNSLLARIIESSINILSLLYGRYYFPTYSNGLKEIGAKLGFVREQSISGGLHAIVCREQWESSRKAALKQKLIEYNADDCKALAFLVEKLPLLSRPPSATTKNAFHPDAKNSSSPSGLKLHKAFQTILKSAHAKHEESKIRLLKDRGRNAKSVVQQRINVPRRVPSLSKSRIIRVASKRTCPHHPHQRLYRSSGVIERRQLDVVFSKRGCKMITVVYVGHMDRCKICKTAHTPPAILRLNKHLYGDGLVTWVVYHRIVLRMSYRLISQLVLDVFGEAIKPTQFVQLFGRVARQHVSTERALLAEILAAPFVHIDETKINIVGAQQYVWVITDGKNVSFRLTPSRETHHLQSLLANYKGVVVSDFYGGFDAIPCRQQKCLVHLIRDLNDDLWDNPFDEEYERFVSAVHTLFTPIFHDIDKYGMKRRNLQKHGKSVDNFYRRQIEKQSAHSIVAKYQKRFSHYRQSLFRVLTEDGIPWNNNMAERALRHLAVQRRISGSFTQDGAQEYLRLLGIAQTCRFQGKSFLAFIRTGSKNLPAFLSRRNRTNQ